jgi:hypothetical protein
VLRRISLHEFSCRAELEIANNLARIFKWVLGFPLKREDCREESRNVCSDLARPDVSLSTLGIDLEFKNRGATPKA